MPVFEAMQNTIAGGPIINEGVAVMHCDIQSLMNEFMTNEFWGFEKEKEPDANRLTDFTKKYRIPVDFIELFKITDGFSLFGAGDYSINSCAFIEEIDLRYKEDFIDGILDNVGYFMGFYLAIDQNAHDTDKYLYAGAECSSDPYVCVGTITKFLQGFVQARGEIPFWDTAASNTLKIRIE